MHAQVPRSSAEQAFPPPHARGGYRKINAAVSLTLNITVAALLLLCTAPLLILIPIAIKLADGGPVFYSSIRLGRHKRRFAMYKFRTLKPDADRVIGATLLGRGQQLETPIGHFLRETRIDELPQLINVIKGDMDLIGPRPERPEIYERLCRDIPGYDLRFQTRPGLIGYAQLFTPHGSPKRIRSLIDSFYLIRNQRIGNDLQLLLYALWTLGLRFLRALFGAVRQRLSRDRVHEERRLRERIAPSDALVRLEGRQDCRCTLLDLNDEAVLVRCPPGHQLPSGTLQLQLEREADHHGSGAVKRRIVHCRGELTMRRPSPGLAGYHDCVLQIQPVTPLNAFKLQKYFLLSSLC
ncbi:sugar transferase [Marichromatium bheemlicum]|uniref:Sugar transferase n=1 Tax=Marichromatium bheemlicum TaxID=365339 RepID=A0ABX1ICS7_9GAMM|nr:sugar transferase [Marichromatium bheemlicum]NKN33891.1 sugar transferase [Marichromatium bheemlicum]